VRCADTPANARDGLTRISIRPQQGGEEVGGDLEHTVVKQAVKLILESFDERARSIREGMYPGAVVPAVVEKVVD
jgi:hypothetical protein